MCAFAPLLLASTGLAAVGSIMQGNMAAAAGEAQKQAYYRQAEAERTAAGYEGVRTFEQGRKATSAAVATVAGSGVDLTGSPVDVIAANAVQNQMDIDAIMFGSKIKQGQLRTQGDLALMQGEQKQIAGYIGAATNLTKGFSDLYNPRSKVSMGGSLFS
jgi:hypothetical protein